jgi:hypothetical protein
MLMYARQLVALVFQLADFCFDCGVDAIMWQSISLGVVAAYYICVAAFQLQAKLMQNMRFLSPPH